MSHENVSEEIVSKFLLNTCRLRPKPSEYHLQSAVICAVIATKHPVDDAETNYVPLMSGSIAEFYIEPMLQHVGDIDVMFHMDTQLAIPRGHPPPTQLPDEFHNYVQVFEIIDSRLPGYVYLEIRHLLTKCAMDNKYNAETTCPMTWLVSNDADYCGMLENHGPARFNQRKHHNLLSFDEVR